MRASAVWFAYSVSSSACGGSLAQPATAPQPDGAFADVPYPPPPSRVETLPAQPMGHALWIDGQWSWDGARWAWLTGAWVIPPAGGGFARWALRMSPDGRLSFAAPAWRDAQGRELPPPRVIAPAISEGYGSAVPAGCR